MARQFGCVKRGGGSKFGCCGEIGRGLMLADMTLKERCSDLNDVGSQAIHDIQI